MTEDIKSRLRDPDYAGPMQHLRDWQEIDALMAEAAAEIDRLRKELAEARHDATMWERNAEDMRNRLTEARYKALDEADRAIEPFTRRQELLMRCGEMTKQEMRTALSVANGIIRTVRALSEKDTTNDHA